MKISIFILYVIFIIGCAFLIAYGCTKRQEKSKNEETEQKKATTSLLDSESKQETTKNELRSQQTNVADIKSLPISPLNNNTNDDNGQAVTSSEQPSCSKAIFENSSECPVNTSASTTVIQTAGMMQPSVIFSSKTDPITSQANSSCIQNPVQSALENFQPYSKFATMLDTARNTIEKYNLDGFQDISTTEKIDEYAYGDFRGFDDISKYIKTDKKRFIGLMKNLLNISKSSNLKDDNNVIIALQNLFYLIKLAEKKIAVTELSNAEHDDAIFSEESGKIFTKYEQKELLSKISYDEKTNDYINACLRKIEKKTLVSDIVNAICPFNNEDEDKKLLEFFKNCEKLIKKSLKDKFIFEIYMKDKYIVLESILYKKGKNGNNIKSTEGVSLKMKTGFKNTKLFLVIVNLIHRAYAIE